jgi:hypothetical protein
MSDRLILKRLSPDNVSFAILYDHPKHGHIDVGRVSTRTSLGNLEDAWNWSIGIGSMPALSGAAKGTVKTKEQAIQHWKAHWPAFLEARTPQDWQQAAEKRDRSAKQLLRYDYLKVKTRLAPDTQQQVERELAALGPPPEWLTELIRSKIR